MIDLKEAKKHKEASTQVVAWYAHHGGDCYGSEATVRGPFNRWFKVLTPANNQYEQYIAEDFVDANYAAYAMNTLPEMVEELTAAREEIEMLKEDLKGYKKDAWSDGVKIEELIEELQAAKAELKEALSNEQASASAYAKAKAELDILRNHSAFAYFQAKAELEILRNPSDGRCMDIAALREEIKRAERDGK